MNLEDKIIESLLFSEDYARRVVPHVRSEYFEDHGHQVVVEEITRYFNEYSRPITKDILEIEVMKRKDLSQTDAQVLPQYIQGLAPEDTNQEWLLKETEQFFQKRSVYLAILDSIGIIDGTDKKRSEDAIPGMLQQALAVSFNTKLGHDYFDDAEERLKFYQQKEEGILFDLEMMNRITDNVGLRKKSLTAVAARTGGGKSVFMCHVAANTLKEGKNVLYISLEMSAERISQRIDANLLNVPINVLRTIDADQFRTKLDKVRAKTQGKLIVQEYPMGSAHAGHFRALIEDLKIKRGFTPDLLVVDYLGICASQRVKNASANSYTVLGSVAEELRSLGQEFDIPVLTGVQINRGGIENNDIDMTDTSDSMKIVHALDLYVGMIRTEELDELGQILVKVLKNRYGEPGRKFVIGVDFAKSQLFDAEASAQQGYTNMKQQEQATPPWEPKRKVESDKFKF